MYKYFFATNGAKELLKPSPYLKKFSLKMFDFVTWDVGYWIVIYREEYDIKTFFQRFDETQGMQWHSRTRSVKFGGALPGFKGN